MNSDTHLVLDRTSLEENFLQCPVCKDKFDQEKRIPKVLQCHHTFCLSCLEQISKQSLTLFLKCPACRAEHNKRNIEALPTDHRVMQMMDFVSQAGEKSKSMCPKHKEQPLKFFCKTCRSPVCRDCTVVDHKDSEGHKIIDLKEALARTSSQCSDIERNTNEYLRKIGERLDGLSNAMRNAELLKRDKQIELQMKFGEYRNMLTEREEYLTSTLGQFFEDQKNMIKSRREAVIEKRQQLETLYEDFKASRDGKDVRKLFAMTQAMKDMAKDFEDLAQEDEIDMFKSYQFSAQNDSAFMVAVIELGEISQLCEPALKQSDLPRGGQLNYAGMWDFNSDDDDYPTACKSSESPILKPEPKREELSESSVDKPCYGVSGIISSSDSD